MLKIKTVTLSCSAWLNSINQQFVTLASLKEGAGYVGSPAGTEPSPNPIGPFCWSRMMCKRMCEWERGGGLSRHTQSSQAPLATVPPYSRNELWANPMPPASPPVLCSHKALHYHRAWRDREALKSGVQWRGGLLWQREGGWVDVEL